MYYGRKFEGSQFVVKFDGEFVKPSPPKNNLIFNVPVMAEMWFNTQ